MKVTPLAKIIASSAFCGTSHVHVLLTTPLPILQDHCTACCLLTFCGVLGVHRCYLDDVCCGIAYALTGGCFFIGVLVDCCTLPVMVAACNAKYMGGGGGGVSVVVQNNITGPTIANNMNNNNYQAMPPQQQQYQQPPPQYMSSAPPPQYMQPQVAYQPPSSPLAPPEGGQAKAGGAFCSSCGTRADLGARFCAGCGGKV